MMKSFLATVLSYVIQVFYVVVASYLFLLFGCVVLYVCLYYIEVTHVEAALLREYLCYKLEFIPYFCDVFCAITNFITEKIID